MSRHSWRGIFIILIIISIPCYLVGFWFLANPSVQPTETPEPSPDLSFLTNIAVPTETPVSPSPTTFVIVTPFTGITQAIPTSIPINTSFPTLTTAPTLTSVPPTTIPPSAIPPTIAPTQPILLPPSDTPSAGG